MKFRRDDFSSGTPIKAVTSNSSFKNKKKLTKTYHCNSQAVFMKARSFFEQNTYFACKKQSTLPLSNLHLHKYFMLFKILVELALTKLAYQLPMLYKNTTKQLKLSNQQNLVTHFRQLSKGRQIMVQIQTQSMLDVSCQLLDVIFQILDV